MVAPVAEPLGQVQQVVRDHEEFLLVAHENADADSLGSALAFADYLRRQGKHPHVWVPAPLPRGLGYLPGYEAVNREAAPREAVAIAFDAGSLGRFGDLRARIEAAPLTVVFDHHTSNDGFGDICVVEREAAASGAIVFDTLRAWQAEISPEAATNLYAAIFTDTGGFRHENTTGEVLQMGADLCRLGADPAFVALKSYKSRPETTLRLQALAAAGARYELGGKLVWSEVTQEMLTRSGAEMGETEGIIDVLQSLDTMVCALLFKEAAPELTRVSVRTRGWVEAHRLVAPLGGGGHRRAAGAEVSWPLARAEEELLAAARRAIETGA